MAANIDVACSVFWRLPIELVVRTICACRCSRLLSLSFVVVLIAIVVLFVVCTTPAAFLSLSITGERKKLVGFSIFRACSNNLELLGFALNFFVYCLCSADIRAAFVDVLFDNLLVLWLRRKWASKNNMLASEAAEEHELQGINEKSAVVATLKQASLRNVANV